MIDGILAVDKPLGWTSHDVVARVRRIAGQREVGHAGTLDPLATGVLVLVLGRATRMSQYLMLGEKTYRAEIVLGATTVTDDAEGPAVCRGSLGALTSQALESGVRRFTGTIEQVPPPYAAVKQGGERLYRLARGGVEVAPRPRTVTIHEIRVERFAEPRLRLMVRCGAGTYIRSLARDIGEVLGTGAYLHALRRMASGRFGLDRCVRLDDLTRDGINGALEPLDLAIASWPAAALTAEEAVQVVHGRPVPVGGPERDAMRLYDPEGGLVALARREGGMVKPFRVFEGRPAGARGR